MAGYKRDGTLEYIGDQFEFGACPNPLCKKFNKAFQSKRSAAGHFGQPCKSECARINSIFNIESNCDDKKAAARPNKKRIAVDMPDGTQFGASPPILRTKIYAAYRPLYTQTSDRVPDPSLPICHANTVGTERVQTSFTTRGGNDVGEEASYPIILDVDGSLPDSTVDCDGGSGIGGSLQFHSVSPLENFVSELEEDNSSKVSSSLIAVPEQQSFKSPFLSESGKPYNSLSRFEENSGEQTPSFSVEMVLVAELIMMLDSMGATKKALEKVLKWHSKATLRNANFQNLPVTRDANMAAIRKVLPRRMVNSYLPYVKPIRMMGFNEDTNVVGFDVVIQILSLLHSPSHMMRENLVLNPDNHFDNYYHMMAGAANTSKKIDCARAGSVYQNYIRRKAPDYNEFVFDLIIGFDSVNVTKNGRTSCCPVLVSSSLFTEDSRRKPEFWKVIGYIVDPTEKSRSENSTNEKGHSSRNMHSQLEVILDGVKRLQSGQDRRLDSVQITIGNQTKKCLRIDTPVLFFILDGKERESVTIKVKGTHKSTRRHSCPCDAAPYTNLSLSTHRCNIMKSTTVEYYVDHCDEDALHNISQHNIKSAFRGIRFCDSVHGVFGAITTDSLHCILLCFFKRTLACFYGKLSDKEKELLDRMAWRYNKSQRSCCGDDYPRTSFVKGITNLEQKEGKEYRGMLFVLCILIHDMTAWDLLDKACKRRGRDLTGILNTFEMMLCLDAWTKGREYWRPRDSSVEQARAVTAIGVVIDNVKKYLPREEGNNWNLPNLHALFHYPRDITRFGPPNEYTTWFMESGHKYHVKMPGKTVAKVKGRFDHSLALSVRSQYELKMFMECANAEAEAAELLYNDDSDNECNPNAILNSGIGVGDGGGNPGVIDDDEGVDIEENSENGNYLVNGHMVSVDGLSVHQSIVSVRDHVKNSPLLNQMLKYATKYTVRSIIGIDGRVSVKVDWLTRSYHDHTIKDGLAGCFVSQHGLMVFGVERRMYCYSMCRIGKWLVRCHPNFLGKGPWYDWVMIRRQVDGAEVGLVPARVASFFINDDDEDRKLRVAVQFAGPLIPDTSSVLFDIYEFGADSLAHRTRQVGTFECVDCERIEKAVYAKVSSDLTKVLVAADRNRWAAAFC